MERREEEEEKRVGGGSGTGGLRAEKRGLCLLHAALEISRPRRKEEQPRITTIREAEEKHRTAAGAGVGAGACLVCLGLPCLLAWVLASHHDGSGDRVGLGLSFPFFPTKPTNKWSWAVAVADTQYNNNNNNISKKQYNNNKKEPSGAAAVIFLPRPALAGVLEHSSISSQRPDADPDLGGGRVGE